MKNTKRSFKPFKRLFLVAVVIAIFFCFASCGKEEEPVKSVQATQSAATDGSVQTGQTSGVAESAPVQTSQPSEKVPVQSTDNGTASSADRTAVVSGASETSVSAVETTIETAEKAAQPVTVTGGNCSVDIISAGLDVDYTGAQVIVVKFEFTNNDSSSVCFGDIISVDVKQNGRTLNGDSIIMDGNSFGGLAFNFRTPVSNGGSVTCAYAYPYSSTDDIDVSVQILTNDNARKTLGSGSATLSIG